MYLYYKAKDLLCGSRQIFMAREGGKMTLLIIKVTDTWFRETFNFHSVCVRLLVVCGHVCWQLKIKEGSSDEKLCAAVQLSTIESKRTTVNAFFILMTRSTINYTPHFIKKSNRNVHLHAVYNWLTNALHYARGWARFIFFWTIPCFNFHSVNVVPWKRTKMLP